MKTEKKTTKSSDKKFEAVRFMRNQRDLLSVTLAKMTKEEILEYFKNRKSITTTRPCS